MTMPCTSMALIQAKRHNRKKPIAAMIAKIDNDIERITTGESRTAVSMISLPFCICNNLNEPRLSRAKASTIIRNDNIVTDHGRF